MNSKQQKYTQLVVERKRCKACSGLINPSVHLDGKYDSEEIGPWSTWQGGLDATVMVVAQDWGDVRSFEKQHGIDNNSGTNKTLRELLGISGFKFEPPGGDTERGNLFFTNAILCLKPGNIQDKLQAQWVTNCANKFLRPQIEIILPKLVVTLGEWAYKAVLGAYGLQPIQFKSAVQGKEPIELTNGVMLMPVYHCGRRILNTHRSLNEQRGDWKRISAFISGQYATEKTKNEKPQAKQKKDLPIEKIPKRLYSIPEAAVYLGRTPNGIREMLWAGKIQFVRDGRRILIDIRDMDEWIEKNKTRYDF